ncbi:acyl-CoA dehydrogenase family protein [Streptomyces tendae]
MTIDQAERVAEQAPSRPESPYLSEAGRRVRDAVRQLVPLMREQARESEQLGCLTPDVVKGLDEAGVFRLAMPEELGGYSGGARDHVEVITEIARGDGSAGWVAFIGGRARTIAAFPEPVVEEIFAMADEWTGPLVAGASTFGGAVGSARKVPGGWMVLGKWGFGSACKHAAWSTAGVAVDEPGRSPRGLVLMSRDQYQILDDWHVMGMSGSSSNSIATDGEVFVPDYRYMNLDDLFPLMARSRERYAAPVFRGKGNILITELSNICIGLGMAQGALEVLVEMARKRKPFNLPYPSVAEMPSAQVAAGKARAMVNAARAVIMNCADEVDRHCAEDIDFTHSEETEAQMDLVYATRLCAEAIDLVQHTLGSSTVALSNPVQRFVRDARVLTTHGAIRFDPLAEISGRDLFGLPPHPMLHGTLPGGQ